MISLILLSVFVFVSGAEQGDAPRDAGQRVLTDSGYMINYGNSLYRYPIAFKIVPPVERNPTRTNEIENEEDDKQRPLFYFTTYEAGEESPKEPLPTSRPYIEIRRKRDVNATDADVPESSKIGKLRKKRTYCGKCGGGGGYGGYYVPVTYAVYPVYYGGGSGRGCNTCGGGRGGYGGGGGSYSYSQSSASSSSGSFGWGKK